MVPCFTAIRLLTYGVRLLSSLSPISAFAAFTSLSPATLHRSTAISGSFEALEEQCNQLKIIFSRSLFLKEYLSTTNTVAAGMHQSQRIARTRVTKQLIVCGRFAHLDVKMRFRICQRNACRGAMRSPEVLMVHNSRGAED